MSHHKLELKGALGTKVRIYLDGPHAGDMIELWRTLKDFTEALGAKVEAKAKEYETFKAVGK